MEKTEEREEYVTAVFRYLKEVHTKEGVKLFSVALVDRIRTNVLKLKKM